LTFYPNLFLKLFRIFLLIQSFGVSHCVLFILFILQCSEFWHRVVLLVDIDISDRRHYQSTTLGKVKVKWSRYRPGVAQRLGRGITLLFHDRCTRREWVVSSTPRPHFTSGKDPVPTLQEAGWAPGSVWTGGKSRPHRDSITDRPARSQSLYRLSYPVHLQH